MKNWNDLPHEMKEMVAMEMGFITRARLKQCSKSDKFLIESLPMELNRVAVSWKAQSPYHDPILCLKIDDLTLVNQNSCVRVYMGEEDLQVVSFKSNDEASAFVMNIFINTIFNKKNKMEYLKINNVTYPFTNKTPQYPIKAKRINFKKMSAENGKEWLQHIKTDIDAIRISYRDVEWDKLQRIASNSVVNRAKQLELAHSFITDNEMINFKATDLTIVSQNLTYNGVNRLIKNWIKNDYPIESMFNIQLPFSPEKAQIMDGIDFDVIREAGLKAQDVMKMQVEMTEEKYMELIIMSTSVRYNHQNLDNYIKIEATIKPWY